MTSKIPETNISRQTWFKDLIDPKKRCMNLRSYVKKVFGKKLEKNQYFALRDMLDPKIRNIYFSTARQCVDGDTLVILKNGKVLPIKDVKEAFKTGTQEVYAIKTKTGKYIECTLDHKFMTKQGWRTMRQIQKQNWFFEVPDYLPYPDNIKCNINDNRLKILGYLLSDGTGYLQYGQSIRFTNVSNLYLDDFEELVNIEFPNIKTTRYKKGNGFDITCTGGRHGGGTNIMQAWINSLTFNGGFVTELMSCNEKQVACFLSRLFAGDGYTTYQERNYEIGLGDNDLYLIRYLQLLLQKFGIHGYYKKDNNYNMYRLRISNSTSIKRFFDLCLIFGKEDKCNEVLNKIKNVNINCSGSGSIFRFPGYDKVASMEFIAKKETYDMEVFPENMYYANGIKVHNSGKTETIAIYQALCAMFPDCVIPDYEGKGNCYVFAPKKEQAQISFERFSNLIHHNEHKIYSPEDILVDKADRITFKNGFEVRAITASRNAEIEGLTTHIIILDESQAISPFKYRESIAPMGGGVAHGAKIIQCGVPGILGSHFHKAFKNKYDPIDNPFGYVRHISPWTECPRLAEEYIMTLKAEDDESFERNYELNWARSNFGYFMEESQYDDCAEDYDPIELRKKAVEEGWEFYWGIDFAKLRDSTVLTEIVQNIETKEFYVIRLVELRGVDYTEQVGYFINLFNPVEVVHISADQTAVGEPILELMNAKGMRSTGEVFSTQFKDKMYKNLKHFIENKKIHWPTFRSVKKHHEFTKLLRRFKQQLMELEMEYRISGHILYHHNADDNLARDDYADSLGLSLWSASSYIPPSIGYAEDL